MDQNYASRYAELYRSHWWWRSREKIVLSEIRRLGLTQQSRILDVGCGSGLLLPVLADIGHATGIETDTTLLNASTPFREHIYTEPLGSPVYHGLRFELITALDVLEHIEDDSHAVSKMVEMLVPGGYLFVTVPAMASLWDEHDVINRHFRRYDIGSIRELLGSHGRIARIRYFFHFIYFPKRVLALLNSGKRRKLPQDKVPSPWLNRLLGALCVLEYRSTASVRLPFGSSILAILRKPL